MTKLLTLFNKLGPRERIGFILALFAIVYLAMDATLLGAEEKKKKALKAELTQLEGDITNIRNDMLIVKAQLERDPFAKDRAQLDSYRKAIEEASAFIAKVDSDPRQVGVVLRQLISATPGVTLLSLKTLPVVAVVDIKGGASAKQGVAKSIYRRGIEVTVRGNYLALLPYLEKLQGMPTRVLWAEAELGTTVYPDSTLKVTLYTLSSQPEASLGGMRPDSLSLASSQ
jgi:MSHA biogenesis protein MshJ